MKIIQQEYNRLPSGDFKQQNSERVEQAMTFSIRIGLRQMGEFGQTSLNLRYQGIQFGPNRLELSPQDIERAVDYIVPKRFDKDLVGKRYFLVGVSEEDDRALCMGDAGELGCEARFADSAAPSNQDQSAVPSLHLHPRAKQVLQFAITADKSGPSASCN